MTGAIAYSAGTGINPPCHARAEEDAHLARSNLAKELAFFEKVKAKLRSRETYQDLLKCLNMFAQEITSRDEMLAMVNDLLGRMPELMVRRGIKTSPCLDSSSSHGQHTCANGHDGQWCYGTSCVPVFAVICHLAGLGSTYRSWLDLPKTIAG